MRRLLAVLVAAWLAFAPTLALAQFDGAPGARAHDSMGYSARRPDINAAPNAYRAAPSTGYLSLVSGSAAASSLAYYPDRTIFTVLSTSSGNQSGLAYVAYPGQNFTLTVEVLVQAHVYNANTQRWGLAVEDNTGKVLIDGFADFGQDTTAITQNEFWITTLSSMSATSLTSVAASWWQGFPFAGTPVWVRLQQTGGNFVFSYSQDGVDWSQLDSRATSVIGTPTSIGFAFTDTNHDTPFDATILSWQVMVP